MTNLNQVPWDTSDGTTRTVADGGDLHARATGLAESAMLAAAALPVGDIADTDYGRAQARYTAELARIRAETARAHVAANNARAEAAAIAKANRITAHKARNAATASAGADRRAAKAA